MKTSVQIIRNVFGNWGSIFLGMIIGFLMMPFLIHHFGDDRYGIWVLTLNFTGYLGFLNLGIGGSMIKYVAEYKAKNDKIALNEICSASFTLYLGAGILALILTFVIAAYGIGYFKIPGHLLSQTKFVVLIVGFQIASSIPLGTFTSYMRGIQRYDAIAMISMLVLLVRTAAIVWFIARGYGLICLALIHLGSTWLEGIIRILYVYNKDSDFKIHLKYLNKKSFKIVFDYSMFFFLYFVSIRLVFAIDSLLVGYFIGTAAVTFYAVAYRLVEYIRLLIMGMAVFQPTVSQFQALSQEAKNKILLIAGTKYTFLIAFPIGASYLIVGEQFLNLWMGSKYALMSYPVLIVLTFGMLAHLTQHIAVQLLQGLAKHSAAAYVAMLQFVITVVLIILMIGKYGITGVAFGKTLPMIIFNFVIIPSYACRSLSMSYRKFLMETVGSPFLTALVFSVILYTISRLIVIRTWAIFCFEIALAMTVYIICAFVFCFSKQERTVRFQQLRAAIHIAR